MTNVTSAAGAFGYTHTALYSGYSGRLVQQLGLPSGAYVTNLYDPVARLLGTRLKSSGGSTLDAALYGYNAGNQRTAYTNAAGTYVLYSCDAIGQVKVGTSTTSSENRGYAYDAAWNLNYLTNNGVTTTYSVDSRNQLTAVPNTTESYDSNGNLTQEISSPGAINYTYDDENRLSQVVTSVNDNGTGGNSLQGAVGVSPAIMGGAAAPWKCEFVYDGLGRLRKRLEYVNDTLQSTTLYIYDGRRVIQERNSANTPTVTYTRGTDLSGSLGGAGGIGGLLARSSGYSSGNWTSHAYYHADGNGNITCLINSSQSAVASYRYDPFGNVISQSGSLADANVYRFSSKEILSHTNSVLYYYGFRFYEPPFQRWLNRDPIGERGGLNLYGYVGNNPTSRRDRLGLDFVPSDYGFEDLYNDWGGNDPSQGVLSRILNNLNQTYPLDQINNVVDGVLHYLFGGGAAAEIGPKLVVDLMDLQKDCHLTAKYSAATAQGPVNLTTFDYGSWNSPLASLNAFTTLGSWRYTDDGMWTTLSDYYSFPPTVSNGILWGFTLGNNLGTPYPISGVWPTPQN